MTDRPDRRTLNLDHLNDYFYEVIMQKVLDEAGLPLFLTIKEFRRKVFPIAERTVWRMISTGDFPKPAARIGKKTAVWKTEELLAWIEKQERKELSRRPVNVGLRKKKIVVAKRH